ncbi:hypothetical protein PFICI_10584 [Pestalotiopsis fici W106-1]|uniref:Transcription factor domain-containing protein n=1 Tax=Pestalotiopsis fici (strain W106-1 / CGMCC3.15140) TaxID=1229662 RepID=W3WZF4_PESFW|nr:uncharacterized protein PFICI_10584 [Pestalotiopsis fici W106-1]ETS78522.1 hypothetical protein PFICI_10584 [Pestalotiopsis fici W106-1]
MACFRHTIRIRQLESWITGTLYSLDRDPSQVPEATISWFQKRLSDWKESIPPPCDIAPAFGGRPYDGYDYYLHFYYNCQRQLYLPMIMSKSPRYVKECAEACVGVCDTFKKLHRNSVVGYSLWALQTVFLAGLTLIYTTWIQRDSLAPHRVSNALNACNVILYIIVERLPTATRYRDAFEELKESLDHLLSGSAEQSNPRPLPSEGNVAIRQMLKDGLGLYDYENMIINMVTGSSHDQNSAQSSVEILGAEPSIDMGHGDVAHLMDGTNELIAFVEGQEPSHFGTSND